MVVKTRRGKHVVDKDLIAALADSPFLNDQQRIETLYLATLSRPPRDRERDQTQWIMQSKKTPEARAQARELTEELARGAPIAVHLVIGRHHRPRAALLDRGAKGRQINLLERATADDPGNATFWTNLGNARRDTGDPGRDASRTSPWIEYCID